MPVVQRNLPIAPSAFRDMYGLEPSSSQPHLTPKKGSKSSSSSSFSLSRMLRKGRSASPEATPSNTSIESSSNPRSSMDSEMTLALSTQPTSTSPEKSERNYEEAFGTLSSWYGVGGSAVPVPSPPSDQKTKKESKSKPKPKASKSDSDPHSAALRVWSLYRA